MQEIVEKMKSKASAIEPLSPNLITSTSPGKRLAVIAALQERPNIDYVDWLAEHVGDVEKPFIGYQAAVALYTSVRSLGNETLVSEAIEKAVANITSLTTKIQIRYRYWSAKAELSFRRK